ncbi:MAG: flagellar basal body rod protein FlgB [Candidatus Eremiobacterota bacterium]
MLEKALNAASTRQQVISNNIANVNNPGYVGQTVVFETHLREAMANEEAEKNGDVALGTAVDKEFALDGSGFTMATLQPSIVDQSGRVDVNQEMANLAKNQIMYNALATKISGIYGALKWVIENSGR